MKTIHVVGDITKAHTFIVTFDNVFLNTVLCDNLRIYIDAHLHGSHTTDKYVRIPKSISTITEPLHPLQTYDSSHYAVMIVQGYDTFDMANDEVRVVNMTIQPNNNKRYDWMYILFICVTCFVLMFILYALYVILYMFTVIY